MRNWINQYGGWLIIAIVVIGPLTWLMASENKAYKGVTEQMNIDMLPNGNRIYEVQHNGSVYVVVERHNGIGICKK